MKLIRKTIGATALVGLFTLSSFASAAVIDFDALDATNGQTVPLDLFSEDGFTFGVTWTNNGGGTSTGPAIFNTRCILDSFSCNGDQDLVPNPQGENGITKNVLILQEDNSSVPDDDGVGGTITLTLTSGPAFYWEGFSAVDDGTFTGSTLTDGDLGSVIIGADNVTGKQTFMSSLIGIGDSIILDYSGSGGIDSLVLQAVPIPAAAWLFISALAGVGMIGRRKKQA